MTLPPPAATFSRHRHGQDDLRYGLAPLQPTPTCQEQFNHRARDRSSAHGRILSPQECSKGRTLSPVIQNC
jgi:hypothetical protein